MKAIRGVVGQVKWEYFTAAAIETWAVSRDDAGVWYLSGAVRRKDIYNLTQRPLIFVAPTKKGAFRWPIISFAIDHDRITARLGPPVELPHLAPVAQPKGIPA